MPLGGERLGVRSALFARMVVDITSTYEGGPYVMNWDMLEGNWKQFKGAVQERWGDLTDDDFDRIAGQREQFIGRVQERYGSTRETAEREVDDFVNGLREPAFR